MADGVRFLPRSRAIDSGTDASFAPVIAGDPIPVTPRWAAPAGPSESSQPVKSKAKPASRKVLVVEDNLDSAQALATLLGLHGHQVRTAHDGSSAIDIAQVFLPEIVLLDIGLPGMDGYEVARRLRQIPGTAGTTLVAMTGYAQEEDREKSREAGIDSHMVKPVDPEALMKAISDS